MTDFVLGSSLQPLDDLEQLQVQKTLLIQERIPTDRCDRIIRLTENLFRVPLALIYLTDENRVWYKSNAGLALMDLSHEMAFCAEMIHHPGTLVVSDLRRDARFMNVPMMKAERPFCFFAGVPVNTGNGERLGTLCLLDTQPRAFSREDQVSLEDLAALVEIELGAERVNQLQFKLLLEIGQLRSQALVDSLTRLWNRGAVLEILEMERGRAKRKGHSLGVVIADLDFFKNVNDQYGHPIGDAVLLETAVRIRKNLRDSDCAGRYGGEEFLVILPEVDLAQARVIAERIRGSVEDAPFITARGPLRVTLSLGLGVWPPGEELTLATLIAEVDKALYRAKAEGRNRVCVFTD